MVIDHPDFVPIKKNKWTRCFSSRCFNHKKDIQFYFTEWELHTGASIGCEYCEECILKSLPNIHKLEKPNDQ